MSKRIEYKVVAGAVDLDDDEGLRESWAIYEASRSASGVESMKRVTPNFSDYMAEDEAHEVSGYMNSLLESGVTPEELYANSWGVHEVDGIPARRIPFRIPFESAVGAAKELAYDCFMQKAMAQAKNSSDYECEGDVPYRLVAGNPLGGVVDVVPGMCHVQLSQEHIDLLSTIASGAQHGGNSEVEDEEEMDP